MAQTTMNKLVIYTDGSCEPNPGAGGWAFVVFADGQEVAQCSGTDARTTNNRMEMTAVLEAIKWLAGRPAEILSDSQYVVKGITSWSAAWKRMGWKRKQGSRLVDVPNADIWQAIDAMRLHGQTLYWVRGHNGNPGNERADELAEMARIAQGEDCRDTSLTRR